MKSSDMGELEYVSASYVVRNGTIVSKHIFAGNGRVASTVGNLTDEGKTTTNSVLYYHPDHLGSSSYVTDKQGRFYEAIEYLPYGETLYNERTENDGVSYKYTGKEEDAETGLYYYGARYYDAKLCRWISVDPILESYLGGKPNGGVSNFKNLSMYAYGAGNPIVYNDPTGMADCRTSDDAKAGKMYLGYSNEEYLAALGTSGKRLREARKLQRDEGMNPSGDTACCYRSYQGNAEEYAKKNLTIDQINDATERHVNDTPPSLSMGSSDKAYWVQEPVKIIKDALDRLGIDSGSLDVQIVGPDSSFYETAPSIAFGSLRGVESRDPDRAGQVSHLQVGDSRGNFLWDPWSGTRHDPNRRVLKVSYIIIRPKPNAR